MGIYQTPRAITAGIAKLEGSMCNNCGVVRSIGVASLRIRDGAGILLAPLCATCERLYRDQGMPGIPRVHEECLRIWAEHVPTSQVVQ